MNESQPYISKCPCCEQGLVRIALCPACDQMAAICDECEAIWKDPAQIKSSAHTKPDGQHPACPYCHEEIDKWQFPSTQELKSKGLGDLIAGQSS
ncbi:MAG: hypothetical protein KDA84_26035 [Planctomycetaceae bacterium]|nr:hypothetical protein [Planctomycetaceae bacterium]